MPSESIPENLSWYQEWAKQNWKTVAFSTGGSVVCLYIIHPSISVTLSPSQGRVHAQTKAGKSTWDHALSVPEAQCSVTELWSHGEVFRLEREVLLVKTVAILRLISICKYVFWDSVVIPQAFKCRLLWPWVKTMARLLSSLKLAQEERKLGTEAAAVPEVTKELRPESQCHPYARRATGHTLCHLHPCPEHLLLSL